ncbi:MAG: amidohydrolase [Chloroflexi bacterium]|nr:amidohydrolase [Chloroflexota bacterium]
MTVVDTHCHAGNSWFEPIESLLFQMDANGVEKAALIQHRGVFDNSYLLESASRHPGRFAVVAAVDSSRPDAPDALERWANEGAVGVRIGPAERSPGSDPYALWKKARDLGLVVSCSGGVEGFASDEFAELVSELSGLTFIIEHLAGVGVGAQPPFSAYEKALDLARFPNTYIKVGGLGEISERPSVLRPAFHFDHTPPLIEMAYDAFGPRRMMWGSDYPPVSNREGYRNALEGVRDHPAFKSDEDRDWVMGGTAMSVFRFG